MNDEKRNTIFKSKRSIGFLSILVHTNAGPSPSEIIPFRRIHFLWIVNRILKISFLPHDPIKIITPTCLRQYHSYLKSGVVS
jgi:hypothetical protein